MAQVKPLPAEESKPDFCVIGIGASAGGLDALRAFFSRMPASPGFACVVIVHLSPEHESLLVQMLQPYTQMPVCQVVKTTVLERNRVYVIPPNANLNSIDTHLRLTELETRRAKRAPIDHFLRTLAETHGETAIGVILTGAGSDGALGIRQIKEHGGLTIAQDPQDAEYGSMPQSAIDTGAVDVVLAVRDMPEEIGSYCATRPAVPEPDAAGDLPAEVASVLEKILGEVRRRTGQEFAMFRRAMVLQRLRRRMRLCHVDSLEAYFEVLRTSAEEPRALHNDLLLNVTEFFRDAVDYAMIERVLREVLERKGATDKRVRIWSIGCSTGEEAYSLAMLLIEQSGGHDDRPALQVFASELSSDALQHAREGAYPQEIAASVSQERLERFFVYENGRYRVRRDLRDMVTFASHDLFKDPPYSHMDLIICRNLLRDLQPEMRRGVLSLFYYALDPHGALIVGPDDLNDSPELFVRDPHDPRLLRRVSGPRRTLLLPSAVKPFARLSGERIGSPVLRESLDISSLFRRAIDRYVPPSVMIDAWNHVVYFAPTASRYVRIPGGELTLDIARLVPEPIGYRLREGLEAVRRGAGSWCSEPFAVFAGDEVRRMSVKIDRIERGTHSSELFLVVFDDEMVLPEAKEYVGGEEAPYETSKLQAELAVAHEQLDVVSKRVRAEVAESESRQERNDELRVTLEELENAREELQAANEELTSINRENQHRIETLAQLSNDMQHMLESTGLAALLVDRALRVIRVTPLAATLLRLKGSDLRRPLSDLNHALQWETLVEDVLAVLHGRVELQREVPSADDRWFLVRAHPYRTALRGVEGVALMFMDITERKRAELALRESDRRKEEFLAVLAHELRNPLAPITSGLEVLRGSPPAAVQERILATMTRQTRQLVRLVDDLLEVGRINQGKVMLRMQPVSIAEVVRDALAAVRPLAESLEQEITVDLPEEILCVEGDPVRLTQVIGNLLHNSARYTPPRGKIAVRAQRDGADVVISVQDSGRGMSAEALQNVFEMFYQGRESTPSGAGLGIGLTLAKKLVEMHCGSICAESAGTERGSKFTVRLPLTRGRSIQANETSHEVAETRPNHRVLVVDDNSDAAETLRALLQALGVSEVQTAFNGPEALEAAARLRPDVVLLDLSMPGMDGYELARRMRAESWGEKALLVALTGWGQEQHRRRSKEAGFDCHLTKPADPEALRALLNGSSPPQA
jgi:two-component system, chemotaxis family, CheB/CheR fusion protein